MAYNYGVKNTDPNFVIDPATRVITQKSGKNKLMQYDHNSECYGFQIPRYIDNHDMSLCDVYVHFINISANKTSRNSDSYPVTDVSVVGDNVVFTWLVSRNATEYAGSLNFAISFERTTNNVVDYSWHTDIFTGISVSATIQNDGSDVVESYSDILTQWKNDLFGIGDTEEASIKSVSETEQAAIEAKGAATLASIPEDYTATYNMADEAVRTKADGILLSSEGDTIIVKDSSDDPLRGLSIFGKSTQKTTTGKNLFPTSVTHNNVGIAQVRCSVTVEGDEFVFTATDADMYMGYTDAVGVAYSDFFGPLFEVTEDNPITFSAYNGIFSKIVVTYFDENKLIVHRSEHSVNVLTIRTTSIEHSFKYVTFRIGVADSEAGKTYRVKIQVERGTSSTDFESYSGGISAPNPDWPQSVDGIASPSLSIRGKNLLDFSEFWQGAVKSVTMSDDRYTIKLVGGGDGGYKYCGFTLPCEFLRGQYIILTIANMSSTIAEGNAAVQLNVTRGNGVTDYYSLNETRFKSRVTIPEDATKIILALYTNNTTTALGSDNEVTINGLSLSLVDDNVWEASRSAQLLETERTIHGIPVTSGGNHTDEDGQQWICDEVDFERGVYIQRVYRMELLPENVEYATAYGENGYVDFTVMYPSGDAMSAAKYASQIKFTHFETRYEYRADAEYGYCGDTRIKLFSNRWSSKDEFSNWLTSQQQTGTPVATLYVLATPIETPLTEVELAAFKSLHTNYPNTTVLNNAGAHMQLKYNANTKLYIDNKFAELAAMMTNNT